ncbi:hypothetical protein DICPUDRAFT_149153 [Dictyostelium purpureum]|uniref:Uncharacterized protein n=1 Tax=Dictyostelium purpureum TaxID=5786 RepID=F0ZCZ6_DICPU|nr:uncharacterized protein DICPUDRAFT_149153 [Dictyostelium purpureum]EGC38155.1 hypothetical protein DICPUDRAFT_149153 [Dictyostelium purpureum]|eukprot:XP_003285282.1 hypothetical protein DICPUDRAFT_149153 [Dictyostelium purpureum]
METKQEIERRVKQKVHEAWNEFDEIAKKRNQTDNNGPTLLLTNYSQNEQMIKNKREKDEKRRKEKKRKRKKEIEKRRKEKERKKQKEMEKENRKKRKERDKEGDGRDKKKKIKFSQNENK